MASKRLSEEFLDGIYEIFSAMMTDQIFLKLLDDTNTVTNIYEETKHKKYLEPLQLVGKFSLTMGQGEENVEGIQDYATATIPTKSLLDKNVDISPQNYDTLKKGVIHYDGVDYEIKQVRPTTNIDNVFQFYVFYCEKPKTRR